MAGEEARITAVQADLDYDAMKGKITAAEAELTYDAKTGRIVAAQADLTHGLMTGRVTAVGAVATHTVTGTALADDGVRIMAIQADVTRTIHHVMHYATTGCATTLSYPSPAPTELRYASPIDETTFEPVESPPRGGRDPGEIEE
jgi:hypothetical protein